MKPPQPQIIHTKYITTSLDISHSIGKYLQNTQKNEKKEKKATTLIYCISDEKYNMEDLLKSDKDWHEWIRYESGNDLKVVVIELSDKLV